MNLQQRIALAGTLGEYMQSGDEAWKAAKELAYVKNNWFIPAFIDKAVENIATRFLQPDQLQAWATKYGFGDASGAPQSVGIVMAGNIPLVGFHDFLCVLISGHRAIIKPSSKDDVLLRHLADRLVEWAPELKDYISFAEMLKGCDAYIATGSNNSSRYFEYYFGKYPSVIRRNRTSVAVLTGKETAGELERLADDIQLYFGLGCRNVTKLYVPRGYDFLPLLDALRKYQYFFDHNKYRNNYDYQLAIYLMNSRFYMTNDAIVLLEEKGLFSPIGTLYYEFYESKTGPGSLGENPDIQCVVGEGGLPFGISQSPGLEDYADGVDTMAFLSGLSYL